MKKNKLAALLLSSVMVVSVVASCDQPITNPSVSSGPSSVTEPTDPSTPGATEVSPDLDGYKELTVPKTVSDASDGKITIYSHNSAFIGLAEKYAGITPDSYSLVEVANNKGAYTDKLDAVLSDGNNAPDIFTCDEAYARKYLASDNTIAINDLGIDYSECKNMFGYTLKFASDDNKVIKGLSWSATPCGVFYQRSLAEQYLGSSDPNVLASSFATWDAVLESARRVNQASGGKVKLIAGYTETFNARMHSRKSAWIMDGRLNVDPQVEDYFNFAKTLYTEKLTFNAEQWTKPWKQKMADKTVVSYWGSLDYAKYQLALNPGEGTTVNPTAGDWGLTTAPVDYCTGGSWVMASKYCDKKSTSADIIRAVCINEDNLKDMVNNGVFVNNVKLITAAAADDKFALEWLGGQNPYPVLLNSARNNDPSATMTKDEDAINQAVNAVVGTYCAGSFATVDDAKAALEKELKNQGILS